MGAHHHLVPLELDSLSAGEQHLAFGSPTMRMTVVPRALCSLYLYAFMVQIMMIDIY